MLPASPQEWTILGLSVALSVFFVREFIGWLKERNKALESENKKFSSEAKNTDAKRMDGIETSLEKLVGVMRQIELDIARHNLTDLKKDVREIRDDVQEIAAGLAIDRAKTEAEKRALNETIDMIKTDIRHLKGARLR